MKLEAGDVGIPQDWCVKIMNVLVQVYTSEALVKQSQALTNKRSCFRLVSVTCSGCGILVLDSLSTFNTLDSNHLAPTIRPHLQGDPHLASIHFHLGNCLQSLGNILRTIFNRITKNQRPCLEETNGVVVAVVGMATAMAATFAAVLLADFEAGLEDGVATARARSLSSTKLWISM